MWEISGGLVPHRQDAVRILGTLDGRGEYTQHTTHYTAPGSHRRTPPGYPPGYPQDAPHTGYPPGQWGWVYRGICQEPRYSRPFCHDVWAHFKLAGPGLATTNRFVSLAVALRVGFGWDLGRVWVGSLWEVSGGLVSRRQDAVRIFGTSDGSGGYTQYTAPGSHQRTPPGYPPGYPQDAPPHTGYPPE